MDAFDSDVLIYAATRDDAVGNAIRRRFDVPPDAVAGMGSLALLPEVLVKPQRTGNDTESSELKILLSRLDLWPIDDDVAAIAVGLGVRYGLKTVDACHLATAVLNGADRFITNNRKDFTKEIEEIEIVYPDEL